MWQPSKRRLPSVSWYLYLALVLCCSVKGHSALVLVLNVDLMKLNKVCLTSLTLLLSLPQSTCLLPHSLAPAFPLPRFCQSRLHAQDQAVSPSVNHSFYHSVSILPPPICLCSLLVGSLNTMLSSLPVGCSDFVFTSCVGIVLHWDTGRTE